MAISGTWVLHYSWGCTGNYGQVTFAFSPDGSFSGGGLSGFWRQQDGTLLLGFAAGPAQYGGTVAGGVGTGAMSTFDGTPGGCWYLTRQGTAGVAESADSRAGQPADAAGRGADTAGRGADTSGAASEDLDAAGNPV